MKFQRIIHAVCFEPWLITERAHASIMALVESRLARDGTRIETDLLEALQQSPQPERHTVEKGIGIVTVDGVILRRATALERMCGAVGTEQIEAQLAGALADPEVKEILLDIDSPGGTVGGIPELGEMVAEADAVKPVYAFSAGQMCSAAYWLAAGARDITAAPSAEIGSIGVYLPTVDVTARYAMAGVKVDLVRNEGADLKGAGYPGTSLTPEMRASLQDGVNRIGQMFQAHVKAHRKGVAADTMRGQAFMADEAKSRNLVDAVMPRHEAVNSILRTRR